MPNNDTTMTDIYVLDGNAPATLRVGDLIDTLPWVPCGDGAWTTGARPILCPITAIRSYSLERDEIEVDLSAIASGYAVLDDPRFAGPISARLPQATKG